MTRPGTTLLLTAAPKELAAIAAAWPGLPVLDGVCVPIRPDGRFVLARSGVGKVNAALAVGQLLHGLPGAEVLSVGLCGVLPTHPHPIPKGRSLDIGDIVIATASVYADEGLATPGGFKDLSQMGFPIGGEDFSGSAIQPDAELFASVSGAFGDRVHRGPIATVSTCSGIDALSEAIAQRTGAVAEAMEGAAAGHAAARLGKGRFRFLELRVVSNTTGDRDRQRWDLPMALARLTEAVSVLKDCLR